MAPDPPPPPPPTFTANLYNFSFQNCSTGAACSLLHFLAYLACPQNGRLPSWYGLNLARRNHVEIMSLL